LTFGTLKATSKALFVDWLIGSLLLAPIFALLAAFVVYLIANKLQREVVNETTV
jgi:uncharacterized membrane protein YGL010W